MTKCKAHNRRGEQCKRFATPGKLVCHMHGGAPRSGAPPGNTNAFKHGLYAKHVPDDQADDFALAQKMQGLDDEIAMLRLLIARNCQDITLILPAISQLTRSVAVKYRLSAQAADDLAQAVANVLTQLGGAMTGPAD